MRDKPIHMDEHMTACDRHTLAVTNVASALRFLGVAIIIGMVCLGLLTEWMT